MPPPRRPRPDSELEAELARLARSRPETPFERGVADPGGVLEYAIAPLAEELHAQVEAAISAQPEWRDRLRAATYTVLRFVQENPKRARLLFVELLAAGDRGIVLRDRGMDYAIDLIDQGRAHLKQPTRVTRATAEALAGGVYTRFTELIEQGDLDALEASVPQLMYSLVLPYLGTEAAMEELRPSP